jgi:hypothetical protein
MRAVRLLVRNPLPFPRISLFNVCMGHIWANRGVSTALLLLGLLGGRGAAAQGATADQDQAQPQAASPPASAPQPGGAPAAEDGEVPRRPPARTGVVPPGAHAIRRSGDDEDNRPPRNPVWGLMFAFGFGGGGDDLVKVTLSDGSTQTLSAGDGIDASIGLMLTPLWVGDALGIGVSGTLGYKGWSVGGSNGDISIARFPFTAAVHLLPRVAHNWLLLARGGIDKETDVSISCSGVISCTDPNATANLGWFGEAGFYYTFDILKIDPDRPMPEQHGAYSLTFRYTKMTYTAPGGYNGYGGGTVDASSFMIYNTFYYNP